jgi:hypothetical protein
MASRDGKKYTTRDGITGRDGEGRRGSNGKKDRLALTLCVTPLSCTYKRAYSSCLAIPCSSQGFLSALLSQIDKLPPIYQISAKGEFQSVFRGDGCNDDDGSKKKSWSW